MNVDQPEFTPKPSGTKAGTRLLSLAALFLMLGSARPAHAIPPELLRAVPNDVSAAYFWEGPRSAGGDESGQGVADLAATVIDGALRVGALSMVDPALRPWFDGVAATMAAARLPFVLMLFDVRTGPTGTGGHECTDVRAALVLLSRKDHDDLKRRIRHLLSSYTNQTESKLTEHTIADRIHFSLRDQRLPEWALFEWGAVGDYYVVSIGAGSFDRVIDALAGRRVSLTQSAWFQQAAEDLALSPSALGLYLRLASVVRDPDADMRGKFLRVRQALHLLGAQRSLTTVRREGRVVTIQSVDERGGISARRTIAGGALMDTIPDGLVPDEATRCTAISWNPRAVLRAIQDAVLSARSPHHQQELRTFWKSLEEKSGVSIERDIAAQLGGPLVIHNAPPHALNLPLAWTFVIPVSGSAASLRKNLNQLLEFTRESIDPEALLQLRRDPDGIWFLHAGLTGPALGMTDSAVVISFSPSAARQNLDRLRTPRNEASP